MKNFIIFSIAFVLGMSLPLLWQSDKLLYWIVGVPQMICIALIILINNESVNEK
jgi:hypothetical protein